MGTLANIVCKGVGIAGMSAVIYDAASVAKLNSKRVSQAMDADHFEKFMQIPEHCRQRAILIMLCRKNFRIGE